jgi:hypothetical protein
MYKPETLASLPTMVENKLHECAHGLPIIICHLVGYGVKKRDHHHRLAHHQNVKLLLQIHSLDIWNTGIFRRGQKSSIFEYFRTNGFLG